MAIILPVRFFSVHLDRLYHHQSQYYSDSSMQEMFSEGLSRFAKAKECEGQGDLLSLEAWRPELEPYIDYQKSRMIVLVQILHFMPLLFEDADQKKQALHELTVVCWDGLRLPEGEEEQTTRLALRRRRETRLFVILNTWISMTACHVNKDGHLAMMLPTDLFEQLQEKSLTLLSQVSAEVNKGTLVRLGRGPEELAFNQEQSDKANLLLASIYEGVDLGLVSLCSEADHGCLLDVSMYVTDVLDLVLPRKRWATGGHA